LTLLAIAAVLQCGGLLLPFMRIDVFLKAGNTYSLLHTVNLMWTKGMWIIALLIGGFSVVFPFVKISLLLLAWIRMPVGSARTGVLEWMGALGKWSMLDPFTVMVLVMLTSEQWAVSATTYLGVYAFLSAVIITMSLSIVSLWIDEKSIAEREVGPLVRQALAKKAGAWGVAAIVVLAISIGCFVGALCTSFLTINQFLFKGESYGVANVAVAMWRVENWPLMVLAIIGLVLVPGCVLLAEVCVWITPARPRTHLQRRRLINFAREWCMLDVMALGLGLFLLEGQKLIKTEIQPGLWLLVSTAIALWLAGKLGTRAAHNGVKRMNAQSA